MPRRRSVGSRRRPILDAPLGHRASTVTRTGLRGCFHSVPGWFRTWLTAATDALKLHAAVIGGDAEAAYPMLQIRLPWDHETTVPKPHVGRSTMKMEDAMLIRLPGLATKGAERNRGTRIVASAALMGALLWSPAAFSVPANGVECVVTSYYSTAQKVTKVGLFAKCPGSKETGWGKKTAFFTTLTVQTGIRGDTKSPVLSCEVIDQQFTCTSSPITRAQ
jgi:hypothetical protein